MKERPILFSDIRPGNAADTYVRIDDPMRRSPVLRDETVERLRLAVDIGAGKENPGNQFETIRVSTSLLRDLLREIDND